MLELIGLPWFHAPIAAVLLLFSPLGLALPDLLRRPFLLHPPFALINPHWALHSTRLRRAKHELAVDVFLLLNSTSCQIHTNAVALASPQGPLVTITNLVALEQWNATTGGVRPGCDAPVRGSK